MVAQLRLAKHVSQSNFEAMASSRFLVATRAFVKVLLALARTYELALQVNRESSAEQLVKAYKKVLLKAHPDKGGRKEDVQKLQEVKGVMRSQKAQAVAKKYAARFRKTCKQVVERKGAAADN